MAPSRERDILYVLFAVQLAVLGAATTADWGDLLLLLAILATALLG